MHTLKPSWRYARTVLASLHALLFIAWPTH